MLLLQTADEEDVGLLCAVFSRSLPHLISPNLRTGRRGHHAPGRLALRRLCHMLPPQRAGAIGGIAPWNTEIVHCNMWQNYNVAATGGSASWPNSLFLFPFPFFLFMLFLSVQIEQSTYSLFFLQTIIIHLKGSYDFFFLKKFQILPIT